VFRKGFLEARAAPVLLKILADLGLPSPLSYLE
jgi:hypothetical protein